MAGVLAASSARAEILATVESPVYEAPGAPPELARKAVVCIGRIIKPGFTTAPTIVAQDIEGGVVVANVAFEFQDRALVILTYPGRAKLTFEGRPGRFRMVSSEIEKFVEGAGFGWSSVVRPKKAAKAGAEAVLLKISDDVAACVKQASADW